MISLPFTPAHPFGNAFLTNHPLSQQPIRPDLNEHLAKQVEDKARTMRISKRPKIKKEERQGDNYVKEITRMAERVGKDVVNDIL